MPSNLLILCHLFFLLPSIFLSIKVFSNESALLIRGVFFWPSLPFVAAVYHSLLSFHKWVWGKKQVLSGTNFRNLHFLVLCYNCLGLEEGGNQIPSHREISVRTGTREKSRASGVRLFVTPWIAARQASLSITISRSSLRLMSIESVMPSSHLILGRPLLLLPPIPPSIRVFSNESTLRMRWPKYWSFSLSISPSNEHPGLTDLF